MTEQTWQTPQSPPPPSPPPQPGSTGRKFRRSRTDRKIGGVAGGLSEYLSVDATVLRVGFVVVSVLFLAVFGGVVLYLVTCAVVPEAGDEGAVVGGKFSGRPWHDWDRSARSSALVLGSLALAFVWSFGLWPWWHWGALPIWLLLTGLAVWAIAYHRPGIWQAWPFTWDQSAAAGAARSGTGAAGAGVAGAGTRAAAAGGTTPAPVEDDPAAATAAGPGDLGPASMGGDPDAQSAEDAAKARQAAAEWAKTQLAAAGVPPTSSSIPPRPSAPSGPPPWAQHPRPVHVLWWPLRALINTLLTLLLVGAVALVAVTTFSGISLKGGFGDVTIVPSTSSVASHYRLGVGELDVNLSNVRFSPSGETVSVNLGVGQVRVEVPSGAVVTVQAHSHIGAATVFGRSGSEIESSSGITTAASRAPHLTLDVRVGVGTIDVTRG